MARDNWNSEIKVILDTKNNEVKIEGLTQLIAERLQSFLPSNYFIDSPTSTHGSHHRMLARENAFLRTFDFEVLADAYFRETRPEFLIRNVGYLLDFYEIRSTFSLEKYRSFLLALILVYFGGSTPENIKLGVELFTEVPVEIIELFKFEQKENLFEGSNLNNKICVLNGDGRECYRAFTLNRPFKIDREIISILDTFKWIVELFVTDNPNAVEFTNHSDIATFVDIIKPDHTLFDIRNIYEDTFPNTEDSEPVFGLEAFLEEIFARICYFTLNNKGTNLNLPMSTGCAVGPIPLIIQGQETQPSLLNDGACLEIPYGYRYCCLFLREPPIRDEGFVEITMSFEERKCEDILLNYTDTVLNNDCDLLFQHNPMNNILDELILFQMF